MNSYIKYIDSFSYSILGLLDVYHVHMPQRIDPDCLSFRAFAYKFGENVREWFLPATNWRFYMDRLRSSIGCENNIHVIRANDYLHSPNLFQQWVLIGEVRNPLYTKTVTSQFYSGISRFFLCRYFSDDEITICDPIGSPVRFTTIGIIEQAINEADGFAAFINGRLELKFQDMRRLVYDAVLWKYHEPELFMKTHKARILGDLIGKQKVCFEYGFINYLQQLHKTLVFFHSAGYLNDNELSMYESQMFSFWHYNISDALETAMEIEERLWNDVKSRI